MEMGELRPAAIMVKSGLENRFLSPEWEPGSGGAWETPPAYSAPWIWGCPLGYGGTNGSKEENT